MMKNSDILLAYDYDKWYYYGTKSPINVDMSVNTNSHILLSGMSGSGKSYFLNQIFARICLQSKDNSVYFADFKQDDSFSHLRNCKNYYPYDKTTDR